MLDANRIYDSGLSSVYQSKLYSHILTRYHSTINSLYSIIKNFPMIIAEAKS